MEPLKKDLESLIADLNLLLGYQTDVAAAKQVQKAIGQLLALQQKVIAATLDANKAEYQAAAQGLGLANGAAQAALADLRNLTLALEKANAAAKLLDAVLRAIPV